MLPESEYPMVLAYRRAPVQRLTGVVRTIREGPRECALTDDEWQTLGLEERTDAGECGGAGEGPHPEAAFL